MRVGCEVGGLLSVGPWEGGDWLCSGGWFDGGLGFSVGGVYYYIAAEL